MALEFLNLPRTYVEEIIKIFFSFLSTHIQIVKGEGRKVLPK